MLQELNYISTLTKVKTFAPAHVKWHKGQNGANKAFDNICYTKVSLQFLSLLGVLIYILHKLKEILESMEGYENINARHAWPHYLLKIGLTLICTF